MSEFSDLFKDYVHKKNVKVAAMAQTLSVDRANLYKVISGKRNPSSRKVVSEIADYLALTPAEKQEFLELYHMAEIGRERYYQRKSALHFISSCFSNQDSLFDIKPKSYSETIIPVDFPEVSTAICGKEQLQQTLSLLCRQAVLSGSARIRIIAQPTWEYLFSLLKALSYLNANLNIEHIICLNIGDSPAGFKRSVYNMYCLEKMLPLFRCQCQYTPYFYYDNVDSHFTNMHTFPYYVITDDGALTCSSDIQRGIIYYQPDIVNLLQSTFTKQLASANTLFHMIGNNVKKYMEITLSSLGCTLEGSPCLLKYASPAMLAQILKIPECSNDDSLILQEIIGYTQQIDHYQGNSQGYSLTFSDVGMKNFLETGRIESYPDYLYNPLPMDMRLQLLRILLEQPDKNMPRRLKAPLSDLASYSGITINKTSGYLIIKQFDGQLMYLALQEQSLLNGLYDFIHNLEQDNLLYSYEETRDFIEDILAKYSAS
ncbi:MAG: helix-turn-helix transcriptional regulator [Lachnospiraceae bacterium]|nr:helix-turn-helix transcriptional regulator [Lachnospiraceae bacterium]MDD3616755.1 helix-turn-helix transcriptional regulator [Lachnospiraceae bacterium]